MVKCHNIVVLGQTISDLLRHILEKYTFATADVPQQMYHSRCITVDVHYHNVIMKA